MNPLDYAVKEVNELKAKITKLENENSTLITGLGGETMRVAYLEAKLAAAEQRVKNATVHCDSLERQLSAAIERERVLSEMLRVQTEALGIANGKLLKFIDGRDQSEQRERVLREALCRIATQHPINDEPLARQKCEQAREALAATGKEGKKA